MDPQHAKLLGLGSVGYRTLIRWENARRRFGLVGCADDRCLRRSGGTRTVSEPVREAVLAVREETKRMAKVSMRTKDRMIRQYVREEFGAETKVPSYDTLRRLWQEWFGPGSARTPSCGTSSGTTSPCTGAPSRSARLCGPPSPTGRRRTWSMRRSTRPSTSRAAENYAASRPGHCGPDGPCAGHTGSPTRASPAPSGTWF